MEVCPCCAASLTLNGTLCVFCAQRESIKLSEFRADITKEELKERYVEADKNYENSSPYMEAFNRLKFIS